MRAHENELIEERYESVVALRQRAEAAEAILKKIKYAMLYKMDIDDLIKLIKD